MNIIMIIGNLTSDPKRIATRDGKEFAAFSVAVNEKTNGQENATFYRCSAWGALGVPILNYLHKGDKVAVCGDLRPSTYTDQQGQTRMSLDINVMRCEFVQLRHQDNQQAPTAPAQPKRYGPQAAPAQPMPVENPADLPF